LGLLDGKSAIITGSARGIGRATAELFVREGAKVLINDLDGDVAEQAAKEIDGETAVFAGDLTKPGIPDQLVQSAIDAFGQVDAVVNNAGYTWDGVVHKMSDEQFQAMLDIHTIVPFRVIRALAPSWREAAKKEAEAGEEVFRKIVNVTSISGTMGNAGQANYSSAKAGLTGLTKTMAKEWGSFKINSNAVAFGFVETRLTQAKEKGETMEAAGESDEQFQAMLDIHTIVPFRVARALAPTWREAAKAERNEGKEVFRKIVNTSSTSGMMGNAGQVNYSAAKMGVVGLTKTLAKEWGQFKINVNAVAFGFVETRLTQAKEQGEEMTTPSGEKVELGIPEQMRQMASAIIPLGRPATTEEASGPVLFLSSPLANYVHGQVLNVTGGMFGGMYT